MRKRYVVVALILTGPSENDGCTLASVAFNSKTAADDCKHWLAPKQDVHAVRVIEDDAEAAS
jgi:hypothetical protein